MKERIETLLRDTVGGLVKAGFLPELDLNTVTVSIPTNKDFGDFATNVAMMTASKAKKNPREIAEAIKRSLESHAGIRF